MVEEPIILVLLRPRQLRFKANLDYNELYNKNNPTTNPKIN